MKECRYLTSPYENIGERRVELWRRSIFLFNKSQREVGPFFEAGYKEFFCEPKTVEKLTPDIIGFSDEFFCVLDISMSNQKGQEMKKYESVSLTEYLKTLFPSDVDRKNGGFPFLVTDLLPTTIYKGYNLIQVYQPGQAVIERITDERLLDSLNNWTGFLLPVPSYGILAVPESTEEELKPKLAGIFKKIAADDDEMTSEGVIQLLLGDLYASFSQSSRSNLRKKVENICKLVSDGALSDYAKYDHENKSIQISVDASNPQSRAKFSRSIDSWLKSITFSYFQEFRDLDDVNENIEEDMEDYED
ncbi:hypothetical protein C5S53_03355 [Methanophagales archaeon]|nr:hypothetical protein C5S53_03355 [Methanophagales archaeon]